MSPFPVATATHPDDPRVALRDHLNEALALMDKIKPSSVPAARLQQIIDELDRDFAPAKK